MKCDGGFRMIEQNTGHRYYYNVEVCLAPNFLNVPCLMSSLFASFARKILDPNVLNCVVDCIAIPMYAKAHDDGSRLVAQVAVVPVRLPCVCVADVKLNEGNVDADECIADGNAGVREARWVDDDDINVSPRFVKTINNGAFMIRLEHVKICPERSRVLCRIGLECL
jgi:hypothetical protein